MRSRFLLAVLAISAALAGSASAGSTTTPCGAGQLHGKLLGSTGAAGTIVLSVTLTNAGPSCSMRGYAALQLRRGSSGLATSVLHGGLSVLDQAPYLVRLAHGGSATIWIAYSDVPVGGERTCPASTSILVRPPGQMLWLEVTATTHACNHGTLRESPVLSGRRHAP